MEPNRHLRITRAIQISAIFVGLAVCWLPQWYWAAELGAAACSGVCVAMLIFPAVVLLGTAPKRLIPARCPTCRRLRAWAYTKFNGRGDAWKYYCLACGSVHDTGVVWTYDSTDTY